MHISPCGWYCIAPDLPPEWILEDTAEKTHIQNMENGSFIELRSARSENETDTDEVMTMHTHYLKTFDLTFKEPILTENQFHVPIITSKSISQANDRIVVSHAFWRNYCVFAQITSHDLTQKDLQVFYDILQSMQPLTLG